MLILPVLLGAAIGMILGLTGAGGGILAVPALVMGLGMSLTQAAPIALIAVGAAAALGAADGLRRGLVRYKAAALMSVVGALTAPLGLAIAHRLPAFWLAVLFSFAMLAVAWRMFRQSLQAAHAHDAMADARKPCHISPQTGKFIWTGRAGVSISLIGAVSGLCTGMLGVGGGFIIVPALTALTDAPMRTIVPTSLMVIALVSSAAVLAALDRGVDFPPAAWWFIAATGAGMLLGRIVSGRIPACWVQRSFAIVCVVVAAVLVARAW
ncbi:TSUP family transporter [Pusillimonas sp. TS35]|uniref:sulfite exporter TauE/SafE family protein n=1 Tax=Paracandidimonas lactea TaxID=2895524 RepID=UPI0013700FB0|nr:sulfite exporter TauE/SafE family protein [Paracandidimonas lactea]MYN12131.1 TSUP family transporter [Pusillimonas sp. TS35]